MNDMSETKKEQLSAFMDNEVDGLNKDIADDLLKDPELLDAWSRYHLISDSLKQGLPERIDRNLAKNVSDTLRNEPAIVAPHRSSHAYIKPVAGFAIAASVAALAILGIQQQQLGGPHEAPQDTLVQSVPGSAGGSGNVYAPVRQVSSSSTGSISECNGQPARDSQHDSENGRRPAGNRADAGKTGEDCR